MSALVPSGSVMKDLPDFYQTLSLKVYQILEDIGATVEQRKWKMEMTATVEILNNLGMEHFYTRFLFGSNSEGTSTHGMLSDVDFVEVNNTIPVVTALADQPAGACLLVQDQTTHPGYCKLQLAVNGRPLWGDNAAPTDGLSNEHPCLRFYPDKNNKLVTIFDPPSEVLELVDRRHGPALTTYITVFLQNVDLVHALHCKSWPGCASEWLTRQRHFSWPSTDMINLCSTFGCLFVPVGHPDSDEENKQWRVSLTRQERSLVTSFNSVQMKCYILLKIIKKELIAPHIPGSLSSYHLKTCMLYLVENTPPEFWRPNNLLGCVVTSLKLLSDWTEIGICPNYFIPAENMFDRHVRGHVRQQLLQSLKLLISSDCKFLTHIQTDNIGTYLQIVCDPSATAETRALYREQEQILQKRSKYLKCIAGFLANLYLIRCFINKEECRNRDATILSFIGQLNNLKNSRSDYTGLQRQPVVAPILPYIELSLMSSLFSLAVQQRKPKEQIWRYLISEKWHALSVQSDSFSSKLKQATFMFKLGYYYSSLDILSSLSGLVRLTLCACITGFIESFVMGVFSFSEESDLTIDNLMKNHTVPCIDFPPAENDVIPTALVYEMRRTEGQNGPSIENFYTLLTDRLFPEWALVDGQFLLHFLLYLNHTQLRMDSHARADISNMEWKLNTQFVSHRETCLNLLGWAYKEQGQVNKAMECYRKSLEVKPYNNAAFWHIRDTENINSHS